MPSFRIRSILTIHQYLDNLFTKQQVLLMHKRVSEAHQVLVKFCTSYEQHIDDEENLLIPAYQRILSSMPEGGAIEFFLKEHLHIKRMLSEIKHVVGEWSALTQVPSIQMVRLFDRYYTLRDLLNHHHAREDNFLYRLLDRRLEPAAQADLIEKMRFFPE